MAAGLPVVATRISGNIDIVSEGENGLLVKPGDPKDLASGILRILKDKNSQNRMRSASIKTVEKYGWQEIARQYESVYLKALENFN